MYLTDEYKHSEAFFKVKKVICSWLENIDLKPG